MGGVQSQIVRNFLSNTVNMDVIQTVINKFASETKAVTKGEQGLKFTMEAGTNISGNYIVVNQRITSYINLEQLISKSNTTQLTDELKTSVTTTLQTALDKYVDSIAGFLTSSGNQEIVNNVRNSISTYVNQTISNETVSDLLLSSSNVQNGVLIMKAGEGIYNNTVIWNQQIQADIMAKNIIEDVVNNALKNTQVQDLGTAIENKVTSKEVSPISSLLKPRSIILIASLIIGVILAILGIVAAVILTVPPKMKMVIGGAGIGLGILVALGGIIYYAVSGKGA